MNVKDYLTERGKPFELLTHPETSGAQQLAAAVHVPACTVGKTVMLQLDRGFRYAVAVLPATHVIDFKLLGRMLSGAEAELVPRDKLHEHCSDCEVGAIPPFGTRYGMMTLVDESMTVCDEITFEGNSLSEAIRMKWKDFEDLEHPLVGKFAVPAE
ncbi:MAG: YbaK/EbsC family protein [Planctomycetaceae bacterium]